MRGLAGALMGLAGVPAIKRSLLCSPAAFEELYRLLMAFRRDAGLERAQIAALSRLGIDFPRVETVSARPEFANHGEAILFQTCCAFRMPLFFRMVVAISASSIAALH